MDLTGGLLGVLTFWWPTSPIMSNPRPSKMEATCLSWPQKLHIITSVPCSRLPSSAFLSPFREEGTAQDFKYGRQGSWGFPGEQLPYVPQSFPRLHLSNKKIPILPRALKSHFDTESSLFSRSVRRYLNRFWKAKNILRIFLCCKNLLDLVCVLNYESIYLCSILWNFWPKYIGNKFIIWQRNGFLVQYSNLFLGRTFHNIHCFSKRRIRFLENPFWRVLSWGTWNLIGQMWTSSCVGDSVVVSASSPLILYFVLWGWEWNSANCISQLLGPAGFPFVSGSRRHW